MRRPLALVVLLSCPVLAVSAPVTAQTTPAPARDADLDARVRALLSGIESAPTREELLALGPRALDALLRLHADSRALGALRLRAITCAGWFPDPRAHDFLVGIARARGQDPLHLRAALRALAAREGAAAVPELVRHARHSDVAVREAVLVSLATLASSDVVSADERRAIRGTLEELLAEESDPELVAGARARLR